MSESKETKVLRHVETLRLFDASRGDLLGKFKLEQWELDHIAMCGECRYVREVFGRQFTTLKPAV
jgi:hypothetical protein